MPSSRHPLTAFIAWVLALTLAFTPATAAATVKTASREKIDLTLAIVGEIASQLLDGTREKARHGYDFALERVVLYYNRARWLDPKTGRFATFDSDQGFQREPATLHKYSYAANNPIDFRDPSGRSFMMGVATGISIVATTASIGFAGVSLFEMATGAREPSAKEIGLTVLMLAAGPAAGKLATGLVRNAASKAAAGTVPAGVIKLTDNLIRKKIADSSYMTTQKSVSIPKIEDFVRDMLNGAKFPPIKVDGKIIVEGHHRYIAARVAGVEIETVAGTAPLSAAANARPISQIILDAVRF